MGTVLGMLDQLAQRSVMVAKLDGGAVSSFESLAASDCESTVSILGGRGHGKTTLLQYVCAELLARRTDLVLPIVRPDRFASSETLMEPVSPHFLNHSLLKPLRVVAARGL